MHLVTRLALLLTIGFYADRAEAVVNANHAIIMTSPCDRTAPNDVAAATTPATNLKAALEGKGWSTTFLSGPNRNNISSFLRDLAAAYCLSNTEQLLLAFAGHGSAKRGSVYDHSWCIAPSTVSGDDTGKLFMSDIRRAIENAKKQTSCKDKRVKVALLDMSCKSGGAVSQLPNVCVLTNSGANTTSFGTGGPLATATNLLNDDAEATKASAFRPNAPKITLDKVFASLLVNPPPGSFIAQPQISGCADNILYKNERGICGTPEEIELGSNQKYIKDYVVYTLKRFTSAGGFANLQSILGTVAGRSVASFSSMESIVAQAASQGISAETIEAENKAIIALNTRLWASSLRTVVMDFTFSRFGSSPTPVRTCLFNQKYNIATRLGLENVRGITPVNSVFDTQAKVGRGFAWISKSRTVLSDQAKFVLGQLTNNWATPLCTGVSQSDAENELTNFLDSEIASKLRGLGTLGTDMASLRTMLEAQQLKEPLVTSFTEAVKDARSYGFALCSKRIIGGTGSQAPRTNTALGLCEDFVLRDRP